MSSKTATPWRVKGFTAIAALVFASVGALVSATPAQAIEDTFVGFGSNINGIEFEHGGFGGKCPIWTKQPVMPFIRFRPARKRIARMQIERHVEGFDRAPERAILRKVVISDILRRANLRKSIDQSPDHTEIFDAPREFGGCRPVQKGCRIDIVVGQVGHREICP